MYHSCPWNFSFLGNKLDCFGQYLMFFLCKPLKKGVFEIQECDNKVEVTGF